MQKPSRDKGFQRERDICLHFAHCPQLSNRFVFVFARVRPPRTRRRGAPSNLGHCHPRHILEARQRGLQKAAERLREGRPRPALATRGRQGRRGGRSCTREGRGARARSGAGAAAAWAPRGRRGKTRISAGGRGQPPQSPGQAPSRSSVGGGGGKGWQPLHPRPPQKNLRGGPGSAVPRRGAVPGKLFPGWREVGNITHT